MITYNDAKKKALERNSFLDTYQEYADAYVFYIDDNADCAGGGDHCCIIEKETGNKLSWAVYFMDANRKIVEIGEPKKIIEG